MGFFGDIFDFAKQAIPGIIGYAVGGPTGAALGGALGGAVFGDQPLKDALIGGGVGYLGGSLLSGSNPLTSLLSGTSLSNLTGGNNLLSLLNLGGNLIGGINQRSAAGDASKQLQGAAQRGINAQNAATQQQIANVSPYLGAGADAAGTAQTLITDPRAQAAFITENPFFQQLAGDAQKSIFANQAALGKLGSGGTLQTLQDRLLLLGSDLLNQRIGQATNLASLGASTATSLNSQIGQNTNNLTDLITSQGSAQAAGTIGKSNALNDAIQKFLTTQGQIAGLKLG